MVFFLNKDYAQDNINASKSYTDSIKTPDSLLINYFQNKVQIEDSIKKANQSKPKKKSLEAPFDYLSSDSTEMLLNEQKLRMFNNAQVKYQGIDLKAENIILDMNTKIITAYGNTDSVGETKGKPLFKDGEEEFEADTIIYNFETKKGLIKGVFTKQGEGYLHSEVNKKLPNNEICIKHGKYSTCDLEHPHYYLALTKAKIIPDDKIISGPAYLVIEDITLPIGIPFGFFPNRKGGASGIIIPGYGDDLSRGFFLRDGGYYFHINDYLDTKLLGDIYSKGSWGVSNETRYNVKYKFNGSLYGKYSKFITNSDEPNRQESVTYNIKWLHRQDPKSNPYSTLSADVNFGSSKFKQFNNTSQNDRLSTTQSSSVAYNRKFANLPLNLSINARQSQKTNLSNVNTAGTMDITLPEANWSMSRIYPFKGLKKIGADTWYEKIGISYTGNFKNIVTGLNEDTLWTNYTLTQFKNGIQHSVPISTTLNVFKKLNISPSLSLKERWYFMSLNRKFNPDSNEVEIDTLNGFARSGDFMLSVPLTTKLYGMYQFVGKDPIVKAVRHVVTPTVSFLWRPDFSEKQWGSYQHLYYGDSLVGVYSKFSEGPAGTWNGIYGNAPKGKSGIVNFNLNNNLEMKVRDRRDTTKGEKVIKLIDRLSFRTGYNLAVDSMNWQPISISAGTKIGRILNVDLSATLNPYHINESTGAIINNLMWKDGRIGRLTNANLSSGVTLNSEGLKNDKKPSRLSEGEKESLRVMGISEQMIDMGYADFSMPWSLNFRYNVNYTKTGISKETVTQTLNIDGSINITKNWKGTFRSGWDFQKKEISYTSVTLLRDLHCWQMSFNWVPFGRYQSYYFKINVKSSMLQDLKYEQRRSWLEEL